MKGVSLITGVSVTPLRLCASEAKASNAFKVVDGKGCTVLENEQKNECPSQQDVQEIVVLFDGDDPHYMSFLSCTVQNGVSYTTHLAENDSLLSIHYEKEADFVHEPDDGSGDDPGYMVFLASTVQKGTSYITKHEENGSLLHLHYENVDEFGYEPDDGNSDDPYYLMFLASTVQKGTSYITKHEEDGSLLHLHYENGDEFGYEPDDGNSDDPYYLMFLASTVQKGTSYMTRHEENGSLLVIDYEGEDSLGVSIDENCLVFRQNFSSKIFDVDTSSPGNRLVEYYLEDRDEDYLVCRSMDDCNDFEDVEVIENKYSMAGERYPDCFVSSKEYLSLDETNKFCGQSMQSPLRKKIITILKRPYDQSEYENLLKHAKVRLPMERNMDLRNGRDIAYSANKKAKSLLDHHKDIKDKLKAAKANKRKRLNILRGFFFWLQLYPTHTHDNITFQSIKFNPAFGSGRSI
ncbi:unnamed protein product [Cuscuta epithymum]|uniref:Uncharacterized protein n=1 Tax=Cuscuta epithymum TaxID=186058 RepID=A0AAV0FMK1_9ASTE|nr:unnamed protein product [Cuscuta epithymum]